MPDRVAKLRPPLLLAIVFGSYLAIAGLTATAVSAIVSASYSTSALNATVGNDAATVQTWANTFLQPSDLAATPTDRQQALDAELGVIAGRAKLARIEICDPKGRVLLSNAGSGTGDSVQISSGFNEAAGAKVAAAFAGSQESGAAAPIAGSGQVLREYLPLLDQSGNVVAVVAIWRDGAPILAEIDGVRRDAVIVTLVAALVAAILFSLIFRFAQGRVRRQAAGLIEAARRDPLTGTLNHGALVSELGQAVETAHQEGRTIAVALLDVDHFRLLNSSHGQAAADFALRELARLIAATLPSGAIYGRYGPDEFLVIAPNAGEADLEICLHEVRSVLRVTTIQFGASDRLPLTISGVTAMYPADARSATELLAVAAVALAAAKASGGDSVRAAGSVQSSSAGRTFGVLQGLVLAVDAKDNYTKRHSEDVARYGVFLGRQLKLNDELLSVIRVAGLLHDIGKIGIPDPILQKPGKLTWAEYEVVKNHVALGEEIVQGLPNVELIREGVRCHHERWDGRGYPSGLAEEKIPLIARILAVADVFSSMTTTRPYRKALTVKAALGKLEEAAGTQLDGQLVRAFVAGMESVPDAPQPDLDPASSVRIWMPRNEFG